MNAKPEKLGEVDKAAAAAAEFEGEIREFVRKDLSAWRRPRTETTGDTAVTNIDTLIQRVSHASVEEIDRVIAELTHLRNTLAAEGERIRREITNYAGLSQSAMTSLKIMADSLTQFSPTAPSAPAPTPPAAAPEETDQQPQQSAG
ncbi:MAG TPA: hypothetical protein VNQ99_00550 [Xanthobacteraceae bacterium]|nr:hypothetical protein [Xanthobacteraceae bacterium]